MGGALPSLLFSTDHQLFDRLGHIVSSALKRHAVFHLGSLFAQELTDETVLLLRHPARIAQLKCLNRLGLGVIRTPHMDAPKSSGS